MHLLPSVVTVSQRKHKGFCGKGFHWVLIRLIYFVKITFTLFQNKKSTFCFAWRNFYPFDPLGLAPWSDLWWPWPLDLCWLGNLGQSGGGSILLRRYRWRFISFDQRRHGRATCYGKNTNETVTLRYSVIFPLWKTALYFSTRVHYDLRITFYPLPKVAKWKQNRLFHFR